jgi:hypothetical protein
MDEKPRKAIKSGDLKIGERVIPCAVVPSEPGKPPKRVLSQAGFLRAIGRARSPKAGAGILSTADELPFFLQAEVFKPFITEDLRESTKPILYQVKSTNLYGYDAELLPQVCEVYLNLRDKWLRKHEEIPARYERSIAACDMLMRGLAHIGIIALVDEATGYQDIRDRLALQDILDKFLQKEFAAWAKRFPDEFYREMFRLRGWTWRGMRVNRPSVVGRYTNDLVYDRLAPGILEELQRRNPRDEKGNRPVKHHQWLTEDVGHPALAQHLYATIGFMKASTSWDQFYRLMQRAFPKKSTTMLLPYSDDDIQAVPA